MMIARRRFHDTDADDDDSSALIQISADDASVDDEQSKKYPAPSKWNFGNFNYNQLLNVVTGSVGGGPTQQQQQQDKLRKSPLLYRKNPTQQLQFDVNENESSDVAAAEPEIEVMTARDRTQEFTNTIRTLQSRNVSRVVSIKDSRKATQLQNYSEFMKIAKHVGQNVASTYSKLEKLTLCWWRQNIFC